MDDRHSLERLRLSPIVQKIGIGDAAVGRLWGDVHEPVVPLDQWESLEEHSVRHREDSGIDPDAERQHRHGHRRESGILDQGPKT